MRLPELAKMGAQYVREQLPKEATNRLWAQLYEQWARSEAAGKLAQTAWDRARALAASQGTRTSTTDLCGRNMRSNFNTTLYIVHGGELCARLLLCLGYVN